MIKLDWNKYIETAAQTVSEGIVMLKNDNNALPLDTAKEIAVFGRIALHYYKSGTGSGGMVNVSRTISIIDGLIESGVKINQELLDVYKKWDELNPFDLGSGWGGEPWSQEEMPLDEELVKKISQSSETAVVVIGRTAGEEQDNFVGEGSFLLTKTEKDMLIKVRKYFKKVVLLLNTGNIIDMNDINDISPDSVLYVWQGGMIGGKGTADVLTGKFSPSGKLTDTIAYNISDYYSDRNFGSKERNFYCEDIYVGYRYFETFAKECVMYPFGFGLSYTTFDVKTLSSERNGNIITFSVSVTNTGNFVGKEVVQIYCEAPQGKLGKPSRVLCGFEKTKALNISETQILDISVDLNSAASYDENGASGNRSCFVLENGDYNFYVGTDVRSAEIVFTVNLPDTLVTQKLSQALAPLTPFKRIKPALNNGKFVISEENVRLSEIDEIKRRMDSIPSEIKFTGDAGIKLSDVKNGTHSMNDFIGQLSDYDLSCIIRGEGMGSPKVTAGTASAFGGVSDSLVKFGIPAACCSDGPSGMRLDCGTKAFSLPNGTLIASTFNKELAQELFSLLGLEMRANKVDCLLGPGMNIHRHPLNGRNFEYFSEDPFLTGQMAAAELKGLHTSGVTGTIKHFCGNNQETNRHFSESVISERALREIYLKGFEIAVKSGYVDCVMTTYGCVNGLWTAASFDLTTTILRDEWKFSGLVMTDWWANINERNMPVDKTNFAAMTAAQNDIYMVCASGSENDDNTLVSLENCGLKRAELQRNAANICRVLLKTPALARLEGTEEKVEIINRPITSANDELPVIFYDVDKFVDIPLDNISTEKDSTYSFALIINNPGYYKVSVTASSTQSELAQIPVTMFIMGTACGTFTWNGTGGKDVTFTREVAAFSHFSTVRLYFSQSGLKIKNITFELTDKEFVYEEV